MPNRLYCIWSHSCPPYNFYSCAFWLLPVTSYLLYLLNCPVYTFTLLPDWLPSLNLHGTSSHVCPYLFVPTPFIIWVTLGRFLAVLPPHTCPLIHPPTHNHSECISLWFFLAGGGKYSCNYTPCLQFPLSNSFIPSCSHKLNLTHSHAACFSPSYPLGLSTFPTFPEISAFHPTLFSPPLVCFPTLFPPFPTFFLYTPGVLLQYPLLLYD